MRLVFAKFLEIKFRNKFETYIFENSKFNFLNTKIYLIFVFEIFDISFLLIIVVKLYFNIELIIFRLDVN